MEISGREISGIALWLAASAFGLTSGPPSVMPALVTSPETETKRRSSVTGVSSGFRVREGWRRACGRVRRSMVGESRTARTCAARAP
ncbi:hypothetical protein GCM10022244_58390 [Streptomyces gulbargensis]|uniref:Secreted protein n=1 Tax=Streptomyces gulbargensis TaxID=364901 RepID=A0ABP7NC73_9ACTN